MQWSYKVRRLPLAQTSHTFLTHWYWWFLKANNSYSKYKHLRVFHLKDDQNALNYMMEFPNCYHYLCKLLKSRYVSDKQIISNLWIELNTLRRTSFTKLCAAILLRFQWQIESFFAVFWLGPWMSLTSPHSKSKLHVNHR